MNQIYLWSGLAGGVAGILRTVKGIVKNKEPINWRKTIVNIVQGAMLGIAISAYNPDPIMAFLSTLGINSFADINDFYTYVEKKTAKLK